MNLIFCVLLSSTISVHGYRKKSLSLSGALAAFVVGLLASASGLFFMTILLVFYFIGSLATRYEKRVKLSIDGEYKEGGERNYWQVLSNGGLGTVLALMYKFNLMFDPITMVGLYMCFYSCCLGDTLASELGILSSNEPILLFEWRRVPRGTNGAVSVEGLIYSLVGGGIVSIVSIPFLFYGMNAGTNQILWLVVISTLAGLVGSVIDSVLGSTVQATFRSTENKKIYNTFSPSNKTTKIAGIVDLLSNNQVNLVSSALTVLVSALILLNVIPGMSYCTC